jgi:hypothetical protein
MTPPTPVQAGEHRAEASAGEQLLPMTPTHAKPRPRLTHG